MTAPAYPPLISCAFDDLTLSSQDYAQYSLTASADPLQHQVSKGLTALQVISKLDELWFWKNVLGWPASIWTAIHSTKGGHVGFHSGTEEESVILSFPRADLDEETLTPRFQILNPMTQLVDQEGDEKMERKKCNGADGDLDIELKTVESSDHSTLVQGESISPVVETKEKKNELQAGSYSYRKEERRKVFPVGKPPLWNNSGRQLLTEMRTGIPMNRRRRRTRRKRIKTQTELEKDEVKGFKDLGFSFREDQLTPNIVRLVPGLKPPDKDILNKTALPSELSSIPRLYPSEDWWTRKKEPAIANWHMPDPQRKGIDMKDQLKLWAHVVASKVRQ